MIMHKENAKVGQGVGVKYYTDIKSHTIINVSPNGNTIKIQRDEVTRKTMPEWIVGGFSAHCTNNNEIEWDIKEDKNGEIEIAHWSEKYKQYRVNGYLVVLQGHIEKFDYNF